jgi:hypothetical protein
MDKRLEALIAATNEKPITQDLWFLLRTQAPLAPFGLVRIRIPNGHVCI